jgi:hypothetical protein
MSEQAHSDGKRRVVCEMNASSASTTVVDAAISHCRERGAELVVVWVVDPATFGSQVPAGPAPAGLWGLVGADAPMRDRLRDVGIVVDAVVRIGNADRVLEEERVRFGADEIFTATDVPVRRCPACGAREDARAVHFCPASHRVRREGVREQRVHDPDGLPNPRRLSHDAAASA